MSPTFNKGGQSKFSMNPQVGKSLYGGASSDAAPVTGLETPAEESQEPTTLTCPECGAQIELTAAPKAEESEDGSAMLPGSSDEEAGEQ